jgi:5'-nucleotidase / UDP-sugar diphosphatase
MKELKKLTILHSNDMHGDFLSEDIDGKLTGGLSMLSGYVNKVRSEEKNVIYAIAGDMFRGSIIDSEFKGISTIEIMNMLMPDVVTIGNHEVDYGIAHLLFIEKCAKFPIINANLYIKTNRTRLFSPFHIAEIGGMKVLFIGIITEEVLAQTKQDSIIGSFVDVDEAAYEVERICNNYKKIDIDLTVLLTHIGFDADIELAKRIKPECGVDIIIGGHSHTLPDEPRLENGIFITQAGIGTDQIGRFDIMVDTDKNSIDSCIWEHIAINAGNCPRDAELEDLIIHYKSITDKKYARIVTRFSHVLTHPARNRETELGNMFSDILKESLGVDIMLLGSGSIRSERLGPIVEFGRLTETYPYDDGIYMIKITGALFKKMVKYILRDEAFLGTTEFYQFSRGIEIEYSRSRRELTKLKLNGMDIKDDQELKIGLQNFHFINLEAFLGITYAEAEQRQKPKVISTSCLEILDEYLGCHQLLARSIEGRVVIVE